MIPITTRRCRLLVLVGAVALLGACKHPLAIEGQGDIVDLNGSDYGCTLEQFEAGDDKCLVNDVTTDYMVNYQGRARPGWRFSHWQGKCAAHSVAPNCRYDSPLGWVQAFDSLTDIPAPTLVAVFEPIPEPATHHYTYDAAGRLTSASYANGTHIQYTYDANGNLLERRIDAP